MPAEPASAGRSTGIITVRGVSKTYGTGVKALDGIDLEIREGEIFALLGPNGAGKTTLIGLICGIVRPEVGTVRIGGFDIVREYRQARALVGLVPQELTTDAFESVRATVAFSRGLFGKPPDPAVVEKVLRVLSLWDKRDARIMTLSGGMKRRVMIAKALAHGPRVLFLDEPTAGVDVNLRQDMWALVRQLRQSGVTIVLTTHYLKEAEDLADRIGVIRGGRIILQEDKAALMRKLGQKQVRVHLAEPLTSLPAALAARHPHLVLDAGGTLLRDVYDASDAREGGVAALLDSLAEAGIHIADLDTAESSLEDIFVRLVSGAPAPQEQIA